MTGKQREFYVEPVAADLAATPGDGAAHAILHRVEVQVEFLGGHLVAGAASQIHPQRLAQPRVVLVVAGKVAEHGGYPVAGVGHVAAEARHDGQRPDHWRRSPSGPLTVADDRDAARFLRLPV